MRHADSLSLSCISKRIIAPLMFIPLIAGCGGQEFRTKSSETGRTHLFLNANDVSGRIEGIAEAFVYSTGVLSGSVKKVALMAEREAPIVRTDTIKVSKANPVGLSLATLFTLGIYPILKPGEAWTDLVGKDEVANQRESPDYSRARSTGRYRWQGIRGSQSETIEVSLGHGIVARHSFVANFNEKSGASFSIDLANLVKQRLNASNDSEILVSITCSCRWSGSQSGALSDDLKLRPTFSIVLTPASYPSLFKKPSSPPAETELRGPKKGTFRDF